MSAHHPIPDWQLEELALGELPEEVTRRLRERLAELPEEQRRLEALQASTAELLGELPPSVVAAEIRKRLSGKERLLSARRWRAALLLAPALATGLLVLLPHVDVESTRSKGLLPALFVYRQSGTGVERLDPGSSVGAGDLLQLRYQSATRAHGAILSIDGRGQVTLHMPRGGSTSGALLPDGERALENAYELDDAPGFERFFFITSSRPFPLEPVLMAAQRLARSRQAARTELLPLAPDLEQVTVLLSKGSLP
jgi:hypothetical protein